MAFEDLNLTPLSKQYIEDLSSHVVAGTHTPEITRYSGSLEDARARLVLKATKGNPDYTLFLDGFSAEDAMQRLIVKGLLKGGWESADTWSGTVDESALAAMRAG